MPKEFTIPPVSFPTTAQTTTQSTTTHHLPSTTSSTMSTPPQPQPHRRPIPPSAPFQPTHNPSIPFMSFDAASAAASNPSSFPPTLAPTASSSHSSSLFLDEPSLLEELEINPTLIYHKTLSLLNPIRISPHLHTASPDLSGPFLYYISFALFQLLAGKVQFGIILGWIAISSIFLYSILNFLAGRNGNLDLYRCVSVVGYCLMPIVIFSAVSLFLPPAGGSVYGFVIAAVFVVWATRVCSRLLAEDSLGCSEHRGLIAYPCFLIYTLFSMLVMF